jgi:hypothetical protein
VLDVLEHARKNDGRLPGDATSFAGRLERLNKLIQKSPRLQLIRPATIALHNLAMTLGDGYEDQGLVLEDIEATREALEPLLGDDTIGLTPQELRSRARAALKGKVGPCPMCGSKDWDVEIAANLMVEFPGEYRHPPPRVPIANLICRGCGLMSMHKLETLGVIRKR